MKLAIIIPTYNEAAEIGALLAELRQLAPQAELIVADGGSSDATVALARAAGALVVAAPLGRGSQLNAGAAQARQAELLLFLHADTRLPHNALAVIEALFADQRVETAKFRLQFDDRDWLLALAARCMWVDSLWSSFGDQTMVMRRTTFVALGGFPEWPLFEDVRMFELARARSAVRTLPACVVTSARRFRRVGVLRLLLSDVWMLTRYLLGVSPWQLAAEYERHGTAIRVPLPADLAA